MEIGGRYDIHKDLFRLLYIRVLTESVFIDIEVIINYVITWPVKVETL